MKSENQSFDELLRSRLDNRVFEPGAQSWEKAEKLILAQEARKSSRRFLFFFFAIFAAAGIFAAVFFSTNKQNSAQPGFASAEQNKNSNQNVVNHEQILTHGATSPAPENGTTPQDTQKLKSNFAQTNVNGFSANEKTPPSGSKEKTSTTIADKKPATNLVSNNSIPAGNKKPQQGNYPATVPPAKNKAVKNSNPRQPESSVKEYTDKNRVKTKNENDSFGFDSPERYANSQNRTLPPAQPNIDTAMQRLNPAQVNADTAMQRLAYEKRAADTSMQRLAYEKHEADTTMQRLNAADPNLDTAQNKLPEQIAHNSGKVNFWFAEAGFTFLPGIGGMQRSFNPALGLGYSIHLGRRAGLQIGLNYTWIGRASDSSTVYTNTIYNFGIQQERREIGLKRLHYVSMPVNFIWHLNGPNTIFGGITANYMLTTESSEYSYLQTGNGITNESRKTVFGYNEGINRFDILLLAGYSRNFGPHWNANAAVYTGFLDLKKNTSTMERNCGIRFTIQYDF